MFPKYLVLLFFSLYFCSCDDSTKLQLRESVKFSYCATNRFLDAVRGNGTPYRFYEGLVNIMSSDSEVEPLTFRSIKPFVLSYIGFGICALVGLLFIILLPLVGLLVCCCRCCCAGRCCGGLVAPMDAKRDPCRRIVYSLLLAVLITVQLAAVILAILNHVLLHDALVSKNPRLSAVVQFNASLSDAHHALDEMKQLAQDQSPWNRTAWEHEVRRISRGPMINVIQTDFIQSSQADQVSHAIADLQSAVKVIDPSTSSDAEWLSQSLLPTLQSQNQQLTDLANKIVTTLDFNCQANDIQRCRVVMDQARTSLMPRYSVDELQNDYLNALIQQLKDQSSVVDSLSSFNRTLYSMNRLVAREINGRADTLWNEAVASPEARQSLVEGLQTILSELGRLFHRMQTAFHQAFGVNRQKSNDIAGIMFYVPVGLLCLPLLILLLIYLGLCFGNCGTRPYEDAGFCNRGVGANLLLAAVGFIFLFAWLLMLYCLVSFLIGGLAQTDFCRYATSQVGSHGPRVLDQSIVQAIDYTFDRVRYLDQMHKRRRSQEEGSSPPALTNLHHEDLHVMSRMSNYSKAGLIEAVLVRCANNSFFDALDLVPFALPVVRNTSRFIMQQLMDSVKRDLDMALEMVINELNGNIDRLGFLNKLSFGEAIRQTTMPATKLDDFAAFILSAQSLNMPSIDQLTNQLTQLVGEIDSTRSRARRLYEEINLLPGKWQSARQQLARFDPIAKQSMNEAIESSLTSAAGAIVEEQLMLAAVGGWRDIPCTRLNKASVEGVNSVCLTLLQPYNAVWSGLGLAVLLFIPVLILAFKLAGLFRKREAYSSDYAEPDYISYHGFYMRPPNDPYSTDRKPRKKGGKKHSSSDVAYRPLSRQSRHNNHHQVSVYPYDAYE